MVPEPGNGWIRYRYPDRRWPRAEGCWIDLATAEVRGLEAMKQTVSGRPTSHRARSPVPEPSAYDDVVYLAPVCPPFRPWRLRLAHRLRQLGSPVGVHFVLGERPTLGAAEDVVSWVDLSPVVFERSADDSLPVRLARALAEAPLDADRSAAVALLPLLPVVVEPYLDEIASELRRGGFRRALTLTPRLTPSQRRALAARPSATGRAAADEGSRLYEALFHGVEADVEAASSALEKGGLETLSPRPRPTGSQLLRRRREAAGFLMSVAELRRRAQAPPSEIQALVRSALWIDRHDIDLEGWLRDDHLRLVDAVDAASRELLGRWLQQGLTVAMAGERAAVNQGLERV